MPHGCIEEAGCKLDGNWMQKGCKGCFLDAPRMQSGCRMQKGGNKDAKRMQGCEGDAKRMRRCKGDAKRMQQGCNQDELSKVKWSKVIHEFQNGGIVWQTTTVHSLDKNLKFCGPQVP